MNREIKGQDYGVEWIPETGTVFFHGILRLMGHNEYAPIADLLNEAAQHSDTTTLDLQKLDFLNSAGINIFYRFIIQMRDAEQTRQVVIRGSNQVTWQAKSLHNFSRLMPHLKLEWV